MKRKSWVALFLTLAMLITMVSPVSAKEPSRKADSSRDKYSWEQLKEKPSKADKQNYDKYKDSSDQSAAEEEATIEEETTSAEEETPVYLDGNLTGSDDSYSVTVTFNSDAQIPEGSAVSVKELSENDDAYQEAKEEVQPEDDQFTALDISIVDAEGNEIEPASAVQVEIEVSELPEGVNEDTEITVSHINESTGSPVVETVADTSDETEGTVEVNEDAAVVNFTVDSFSTFTLTYAAKSADNADNNEGIETYARNDLNVSLIDENGGSVGSGTAAISANNTSWTSVDDLAPSISGYNFVGAYVSANRNTEITYIRYYESWRPFGEDRWVYSTSSTTPNSYDSGTDLNSIYFVYEADDGMVTLTFNGNGGNGGVPETIEAVAGTTVTLPDYNGYRNGYEFIGWTLERNASFPSGNYVAVYEPDSSYELNEDTTLYAAWQLTRNVSTTGYFFIRTDGTIPYEPSSYATSAYTTGIRINNAITVQNWVVDNDTTKPIDGNHIANDVTAELDSLPSNDQISAVCQRAGITYNEDEYYILWYVQKYQWGASYLNDSGRVQTLNDGYYWHIDGVLLRKDMVSISYNANLPAGVTTQVNVPLGYQVASGTEVQIGENTRPGSNDFSNSTPSLAGYTFMGWSTNPSGTGTIYQPEDTFLLEQDTTMYAIWSKSGNIMTLTKVDGMDNPLGGASFTITGGANPISFTTTDTGTYTNRNVETDTVYTVTETAAPAGYDTLAEPFSFVITSDGENLNAYICNENKQPVDAPDGVTLDYTNGTVNITVTNIGYFYIFHTADVDEGTSVVEIPIMPDSGNPNWNEDGTYNIVNETTDDFLYGGYYKDYAGKGNYSDENRDDLTGSETYKGDQTSWDGDQAYTENGMAMTPVAGTTYYLKEVPDTYLHPATYVVYDTINNNQIVQLYLMTATDDQNYSYTGFDVTLNGITVGNDGNSDNVVVDSLSDQVTVKKDGQDYQTLDAETVFSDLESGYLAISANKPEYIVRNANYVEKPYWVTLDGVKVTGDQNLKVYLRNTTYKDGWKLPGITKTAQTAVPTVTYVGTEE